MNTELDGFDETAAGDASAQDDDLAMAEGKTTLVKSDRARRGRASASRLRAEEFTDALDRFADTQNPASRASAATRIAYLATTVTEDSNSPAGEALLRASTDLTFALPLEEHPAVRDAVARSLGKLVVYAANSKDDLRLERMIEDLAFANRIALVAFVEALARYAARREDTRRDPLQVLVGISRFCGRASLTHETLRALAETDECRAGVQAQLSLRQARHVIRDFDGASADLPDLLYGRAQALTATRDTLAQALRAMGPHSLRRNLGLSLAGVFLAGARLEGARLESADLCGAWFQGAALRGVNFVGADLSEAHLTGASLENVCFVDPANAELAADLTGADWWRADDISWTGDGEANHQWLSETFPTEETNRAGDWVRSDSEFARARSAGYASDNGGIVVLRPGLKQTLRHTIDIESVTESNLIAVTDLFKRKHTESRHVSA